LLCACGTGDKIEKKAGGYVGVSKKDARYLALSTGETYIPVGMNICFPRFLTEQEAVFADYEKKFAELSKNGGNYCRIWLSHPFFQIEDAKEGEFNPQKVARVDRLFDLADKYGIRMKLCFENFTKLEDLKPMFTFSSAPPFDKRLYMKKNGGSFGGIEEFFATEKGKQVYLKQAKFFADRYGNRTCVFAWEVWNELNCVSVKDKKILSDWNADMYARLKKMFPNHMVVLSMGSYVYSNTRKAYADFYSTGASDITQVHQYLDEGHASKAFPICVAPTDEMCAEAVEKMLELTPEKPVLLAEVGATEPNHVGGPSRFYAKDVSGILLYDQTFAPFFAGAAGNGMSWHWEYYVQKNNLWYVFGRFSRAIASVDPVAEEFKPKFFETKNMRVYVLEGKKTILAYCRDKNNSWRTELLEGVPAVQLKGESANFSKFAPSAKRANVYLPYSDSSTDIKADGGKISLPDFMRCAVVRIEK